VGRDWSREGDTDDAAALAADAVLYAGGLPAVQQATLTLFADWFKATFPRVEAVREAKRQVEFDFGQTQALEHHNLDFNELLDKLPGTRRCRITGEIYA
jgi:hypothetical protein